MKNTKGQIILTVPLAMTVASFIAAPIIAYFSAQASTAKDIAAINTQVQVLDTNQANVKESLDEIKTKVDALLVNRGLNPELILEKAQVNQLIP